MSKKTPKVKLPIAGKSTIINQYTSENLYVIWLFDRIDRNGNFAFDIHRHDFDHKGFLDKLFSYSRMTWREIRNQTHDTGKSKHHYITEVERFSDEAKSRLFALKLTEDTDRIFSFAFNNKLRIIGLREWEFFHAVWYDPYHEFYPSHKSHT